MFNLTIAAISALIILELIVVWLWKQAKDQKEQLAQQNHNYREKIQQLEAKLIAAQQLINEEKRNTDIKYALTDVLPESVIGIDMHENIVLLNHTAQLLLGIPSSELVGKPLTQSIILTSNAGMLDYSAVHAALAGKQVRLNGLFLRTQRGQRRVRGYAIPLGESGVALVLSDITEEFGQEEEQKAFFSAAAHELRTPLTVIRSIVSLLADEYDKLGKDKILEFLHDADTTTVHLISIVNDFLDVSRLEQGRLSLHMETFDLLELVTGVIAQEQPLFHKRVLYLTHETEGIHLPPAVGDKNRCREILTNLISNGMKYTYQGGVTITHALEKGQLITRVTDTGVGIAADNRRLLFRKFQQLSGTRTQSRSKSTGLGLYIAKKMAQLMNGDVILEKSAPGEGSTFAFLLPVAAHEIFHLTNEQ